MRTWCAAALFFLVCSGELAAAGRIDLISDINGRYGSVGYHSRVGDAVAAITASPPHAVISTGDMIAGQRQPKLDAAWLDRMWEEFTATVLQPLSASGIPFLVTPGNHDGSALPGFELEQARFQHYWLHRNSGFELIPGSEWPRRYAARIGDLLVVSFDGTRPGRLPADERAFVERMLSQHSADAPFTLVISHLPLWPLARGREKDVLADGELLALLHRHGVDVYASGHHHVFYAGLDEAGLVHVSVGALGGNARSFSGRQQRQPFSLARIEWRGERLEVSAFSAPSFAEKIETADLPEQIDGPLGVLKRLQGRAMLRP